MSVDIPDFGGEMVIDPMSVSMEAQDYALESIQAALGIDDDTFAAQAQADRTYWTSLVNCVADFNRLDQNGEVITISADSIKTLHDLANENPKPHLFLQLLTDFRFAESRNILRARPDTAIDALFWKVTKSFTKSSQYRRMFR